MQHYLLAATWIGQEHRFFGLDFSWLDLLGLLGQVIFSFRFITQWIESERRGVSYIPVSFWYWSLVGSLILTAYWTFKRSPVGILANLPNAFIYLRNLQLIKRQKLKPPATVSPPARADEHPFPAKSPPSPVAEGVEAEE